MPATNLDLAVGYDIHNFDLSPCMFSDDEGAISNKNPVVPPRLAKEMRTIESSKIVNMVKKHLGSASSPTIPQRVSDSPNSRKA